MIIFCDGGYKDAPKNKGVISWGVVVESEELGTEISGARIADRDAVVGSHEHFAFIQAVAFAAANNIQPSEVTFYCDAEAIVYANQVPQHEATFNKTMKKIQPFFSPLVIACASRYMRESRFVKVKGHSNCVNNARADYLATYARNKILGAPKGMFKDFTDWLMDEATKPAALGNKHKYIPALALLFGTQPVSVL